MTVRVLVIEDDRDITHAIGTLLGRAGFAVSTATDGRAGLVAFHRKHPGLVVLDIGLPVLDGWQVLERIRDMSDVPVLILTAHGLEVDKVRGLRMGADDYLTKPFINQEFLARVCALLRRPRTSRTGKRRLQRRSSPSALYPRSRTSAPSSFDRVADDLAEPPRPDRLLDECVGLETERGSAVLHSGRRGDQDKREIGCDFAR